MTKHSVEAIVAALNAGGVRYLIAGCLAVVAHEYVRFTADVDMMIDLEPQNVARAIEVRHSGVHEKESGDHWSVFSVVAH